ncbi:cyclohexanecarboxylate-CoA ligase [Paenibacillus sp. yr247]|uniref:AMP-binding protein n=1 Tax=Paenibacillus sp. yr247 TaxID=1761880 RepID=UPI0008837FC7|nr:AMP-binding protein [Paenibacillus sp. yr247]SDO40371.1 cyclohexanecarboxylate-CoA ligase [Paenibacillus sp. yr247]
MMVSNKLDNDLLFLNRFVNAAPHKDAIVDLSYTSKIVLSKGELDDLANRVAKGLIDRGVQPGENVAYLLPNGWEFVVLTLAIWKIGAVACPMLPALREREIPFIMNRSRSRLLILPTSFHNFKYGPLIESVCSEIPGMEHFITVDSRDPKDLTRCLGGLADQDPDFDELERRRPGSDSPAQLLFTSGTTGEPKGVIHTHGTLSHGVSAHVEGLGLTSEDTLWIPSPMAHQTGFLYGMIMAMYIGATQVCQAEWNMAKARMAIEEHGATFVQAAMPFLADLTREERPPQGLRIFIATGAPVPRSLALEASERLNCKVAGGWGSTESCMISVGSVKSYNESCWNSDGQIIAGREMKVTDEQGQTLPPGQEGLFKVKTPAMFTAYLDHPEWYEAAVDEEGFFNTGDLAIIDGAGNLHLTGRVKDIINRGGIKIPVAEIENLLYQMEDLRDVAVVGMPCPRLNERICVYATLNNMDCHVAIEDLTSFLKDKGVTKIYWPERLETLQEMPRTTTGKIQKYVLRQMIADKLKADEKTATQAGRGQSQDISVVLETM